MKFIFSLVVLIVLLSEAFSLKKHDLCIRIQNKCKGHYDSNHNYETKCEKTKCEGKLGHKCGSDYCAVNKRSCDTVFNLMFLLRSYKGLLLFEKELEKYTDFIQKINFFPTDMNQIQESDICLNGAGCVFKSGFSLIGRNDVINSVNCPCKKENSFECGDKYCTDHSNTCDGFKQNGVNFTIKKCGNDNQILRKKFSFF